MSDYLLTPWQRQKRWVRTHIDTPLKRAAAVSAAAAVVILLGALVWWGARGGDGRAYVDPPGFALAPSGDDVPRLAPIRVTFASPPTEKVAERLVQLEPPTPGTYAWLSERTVIFQPDFPGLLRGGEYTVTVPARPETGLTEEVSRTFTVTGLLTVQQAIPSAGDSEVPLEAPILVQFSRSVAPLTTLAARSDAPVLTFDPPLEGAGEWLNTSIYRFVPKSLAPYTTYRVTVPKGLTSAADGVLKEDFAWSFTTVSPAVASVTPDNNTQFASPTQTVTVVFNQPMADSAGAGISLHAPDGSNAPGAVSWDATHAIATFTPSRRLEYLAKYTVVVQAGLAGANGGQTAEARTSTFTTVGLPAVASTQPANGATAAGRYGVTFNFTNPMDEESLEGKVTVSGIAPDDTSTNVYNQQLYVGVTLQPSKAYTVTLAPGAKDRYGQVMGGYTFSFTTGVLPSSVTLALPGYGSTGTYSASVEPMLYFHSTNSSQVSFTLYPLTDSEAALLLGPGGGGGGPKWAPSQAPLRAWTVPVDSELNEILLGSTSLSDGGPLPRGYYYVTTGGSFASWLTFAVVDTEIVTKLSNDQLLAWAVDHDTGQPVAGATISAIGPGITPASALTGNDGVASFSVPEPNLGKELNRRYMLTLRQGGRFGVVSTDWQQGAAPYQLNLPTEYFAREWVGQLYTDRPIYRPGETVAYKGIVRADDDAQYALPPTDPPLDFVILNARGQEVKREEVHTSDFGTFAGTFTLPSDAPVGDYSISIQQRGDQNARYMPVTGNSFLVAEFRKPEFQVELSTGAPAYINGETIDVSVAASFYFGGAVTNAGVQWSVMATPFSPRVEGFEHYSFSDYDYWRTAISDNPVRASGTSTTGPDGVARIPIPAALQASEGAQQFTISATVTDQNAQAVASSTTVTVHLTSAPNWASVFPAIGPAPNQEKSPTRSPSSGSLLIPRQWWQGSGQRNT